MWSNVFESHKVGENAYASTAHLALLLLDKYILIEEVSHAIKK